MHTTQCHAFEPAVTAREPHQRNVCEYLHIRGIVQRDSTPEKMTIRMQPGSLKKTLFLLQFCDFQQLLRRKKFMFFFFFLENRPQQTGGDTRTKKKEMTA